MRKKYIYILSIAFDLRDPQVGEALPGKVDVSLHVLADDGLLVGAGNVVPFDSVAVEVVEDSHAGLGLSALATLAVVRLTDARTAKKERKRQVRKLKTILVAKYSYPPVKDQSWKAEVELVGERRAWLADQNHPLTLLGKKSGRSQPSKSQRRPEVQMYFTPAKIKLRGKLENDRERQSNYLLLLALGNCCKPDPFKQRWVYIVVYLYCYPCCSFSASFDSLSSPFPPAQLYFFLPFIYMITPEH